jgi:hypothetical protein
LGEAITRQANSGAQREGEIMNPRKKSPCRHWVPAVLQRSAGPSPIQRTRLLIDAACAARASSGQMTLNDWRDVEQEVKRRINYGGKILRVERPAGTFVRRLVLSADACGDEIHAILQDGVLELHVPRRPPPDENGKSNIIPFEEPHL